MLTSFVSCATSHHTHVCNSKGKLGQTVETSLSALCVKLLKRVYECDKTNMNFVLFCLNLTLIPLFSTIWHVWN